MNGARRAARGRGALAGALALAAFALAALASVARAQEEQPAPTAKAPDAFEFDRAVGPLAFEVDFKLADRDDAHLQILFDEAAGESSQQEREILGLDFQPFEGAKFVLSRSTKNAPLVSSTLQQVPEPKELEFKLQVELPQEGGLSVTLADGFPVVIATTPRAQKMKVQFAASGGVIAFTATKAERKSKLKLDAKGEAEMAGLLALPPPWEKDFGGPPYAPTLGIARLPSEANPPPLKEMRSVDRRELGGLILERFVAEFEAGIESPVLLTRPAGAERVPVLLCVGGSPEGNSDPAILSALGRAAFTKRAIVSFELIGTGERRTALPHDDLRVPELELVGSSSFDVAMVETTQMLQWLRTRTDLDASRIAIAATGAAAPIPEQLTRSLPSLKVESTPPPVSTPFEVALARIGDDYLHLRFDSCQLERALELREQLPAPDESRDLRPRIHQESCRYSMRPLDAIVFTPGEPPVRWITFKDAPPLRSHVTIVASDRGRRVALEEAIARLGVRGEESFVAIDRPPLSPVDDASDLKSSGEMGSFLTSLEKARGAKAEPPRVFVDGSAVICMIAALVRDSGPIASFTAVHAIPSFEILLARPFRAHRAHDELGVLTQGMPYEVFVDDVLEDWEIEDAVLFLKSRGVAIDWQDPVDSLRRPLTRHDRLAMWPRVRHAEFVR